MDEGYGRGTALAGQARQHEVAAGDLFRQSAGAFLIAAILAYWSFILYRLLQAPLDLPLP